MAIQKIGIIGLGLMGGSIGIALKEISPKFHFIGLDHNKNHCEQALKLGLVNEIVQALNEISQCDIIFLTVPVDGIITIANKITILNDKCTISYFGGTKERISESIPKDIRANFVTAHPMTGTEKFGPTAAIDNLYKDKVIVLCDIEKSGIHQQEVAKSLFLSIGMKIVLMDAKEHDRHAAFISHMPHALSYSLANSVMKQEAPQSIIALAGGGFRHMSRVAKSSPNMWEDIFRQNKTNLLEAISVFQSELQQCQAMIENEDWDTLNSWMMEANTLHNILDYQREPLTV